MIQIAPPDPLFQKLLGSQSETNGERKVSRFTIISSVPDGKLLYSILTKEFIFLSLREYESLLSDNNLFQKWLTVPADKDESLVRNQLFSVLREKTRLLSPHKYTILTTTGCNARCYYCYEQGRKIATMGESVAEQAASFIWNNYHKNHSPVVLRWFGGEPLLNTGVINYICNHLASKGVPFSSQIVSNGFLLNSETIVAAKNIWRAEKVQITLDGTRNRYNTIKNYSGGGDPYSVVLSNILSLLKSDIQVSIRLNLSDDNYNDLCVLIEELAGKFGDYSAFSVYVNPLFEKNGKASVLRSEEERTLLYQQLYELHKKLVAFGIGKVPSLPKMLPQNQCMADSGAAVVISPEGNLGLCDMCSDSEFFGSLHSDQYDSDMIKSWHERISFPECDQCPLSPECIRLKKCIEYSFCSEAARRYRVLEIQEAMLQTYKATYDIIKQRY